MTWNEKATTEHPFTTSQLISLMSGYYEELSHAAAAHVINTKLTALLTTIHDIKRIYTYTALTRAGSVMLLIKF